VSVAKPIDFCALAPAPLTSVGIKRMTGKKKLHLIVRTDDDVSMNYHAYLHRKSSARQSLRTAIRVPLRALETEQNSWQSILHVQTTSCFRVVRITSGTELSRHFRMPRPADLNIFAGHAVTFHDQSSASRCRRYVRRTPSSPT
jgi:hypothetical protein